MNNRAQSNVIGALLIVGILTAAAGSTLATVVPQEGQQAELEHRSEIETDIVDLRNQINNAVDGEGPRAETIRLGVEYPSLVVRFGVFASSEAMRYEDMGDARLVDTDGNTIRVVESGVVEYEPSMNYIDRGPMYIENSVYHRTGGIAQTEQQLVRGNTIRLVGTQADLGVTQSRPYVIDVAPGNTAESYHSDIDRLEFPTRLSEDEWEILLDGQTNPNGPVEAVSKSGGRVTVSLDDTRQYRVLTGEVGLNREPASGRRIESETRDTVNPRQIGGMILQDTGISGNEVTLEWATPSGETKIIAVRANFFKSIGGGGGGNENGNGGGGTSIRQFNLSHSGTDRASSVRFGGTTKLLSPNVKIEGTETITLKFENSINSNQEFFMITITVGDGQRAQYIIG